MITILYAGILGLVYVALTGFVIRGRYRYKISLGDAGNAAMTKRIRAHGNFAEYVPFALLLLFLTDYVQYAPWIIHVLGVLLVVGRISHAIGLNKDAFLLRSLGMILTLGVIVVSSLLLIWHYTALHVIGF